MKHINSQWGYRFLSINSSVHCRSWELNLSTARLVNDHTTGLSHFQIGKMWTAHSVSGVSLGLRQRKIRGWLFVAIDSSIALHLMRALFLSVKKELAQKAKHIYWFI